MQARQGKARALLVLALLAGGALLYQFLGSADSTEPLSLPLAESEQEEDPKTASEEDDSEEVLVAAESQAPAIEDGSQAEALSGARTQQAPRLIHGLVRDDQGRGIAGATISWTGWDPEYLKAVTAGLVIPRELIGGRTVEVTSGPEGAFEITDPPSLVAGEPSFLWVSHESHLAGVIELEPDEASRSEAQIFALESAPPVLVRVTQEGAGVEGAEVFQQHAFPVGIQADYIGGERAPKALLVYSRRSTTGKDGTVAVAPSKKLTRLQARKDDQLSMPREGHDRSLIELQLSPTFSVSGLLELSGELPDIWGTEELLNGWGYPRIRFLRVRGILREEVGSTFPDGNADFGPLELPVVQADYFVARLESSGYVVTEERFETPGAGEEVYLELPTGVGEVFWFKVLDEAEEIIPRAVANVHWEGDDGESFDRVVHGVMEGYIGVTGLPPGMMTATITAKGKGLNRVAPIAIPVDPPFIMEVVLYSGYTLKGRCLRGIEPVSEFELRYWVTGDTGRRGKQTVLASPDGEFVIENLPSPRVSVMAISPSYERSETAVVDLRADSTSDVLLQLSPPRTAKGTIVDGRTGDPVTDARVTLYINEVYSEIESLGDEVSVDGAGRFELPRLAAGMNVIAVTAPGYSDRELKVKVLDQAVDMGSVEILPSQPLTARLVLPEGEDPTQWALSAKGIGAIPFTRFDAAGEIFIEEANEGSWAFVVRDLFGMEEVLVTQNAWLRPGEEWHLDFNLVDGRSLVVTTTGAEAGISLDDAWVGIDYPNTTGGRCYKSLKLDEHGKVRMPGGLGTGIVRLVALDYAGQNSGLGAALAEVTESDPDEVVINLPLGGSRRKMHVTNQDGEDLSGVWVRLRSSTHPQLRLASGHTDTEGLVVIAAIIDEADRVDLTSQSGGLHYDLEFVMPKDRDEVIEIVFDDTASIDLRFMDEGVPQVGVTCRLWATELDMTLTSGQTPDEEGRIEIEGLSPGPYELRVDGASHWPVRVEVEARSASFEQQIEVRRVGSVELEFVRGNGSTFANEEVELECTSLGERALNWIAAGKLQGFEDGLRTDESGKLSIQGIPHGEYRWTANGSSGTFDLAAGELFNRRLILP